jgi:hypothetical protein
MHVVFQCLHISRPFFLLVSFFLFSVIPGTSAADDGVFLDGAGLYFGGGVLRAYGSLFSWSTTSQPASGSRRALGVRPVRGNRYGEHAGVPTVHSPGPSSIPNPFNLPSKLDRYWRIRGSFGPDTFRLATRNWLGPTCFPAPSLTGE